MGGPKDSIKQAMRLRLQSKTREVQQRDADKMSSDAQPERDTVSPYAADGYTDEQWKSINETLGKMEQTGPGPNTRIAQSPYTRILHQAKSMTESHLDTIETTLGILVAIEGFSPHVKALKEQMLEKQQWVAATQERIVQLEMIEEERRELAREEEEGSKEKMEQAQTKFAHVFLPGSLSSRH